MDDNLLYPSRWSPSYALGFLAAASLGALAGRSANLSAGQGALLGVGALGTIRLVTSTTQIAKVAAAESRASRFLPV